MYRLLLCLLYIRIISLSTAVTEELFLLGAGDNLVGVTTYCERPVEAKEKEKIGSIKDIDIEKIISLKPDLVVASSLTDIRQIEKLKTLEIDVVSFPLASDFSSICKEVLELGRLVGEEEKAKEIVKRAMERVNKVRERVKDLPNVTVFIQVGARPLCTMTKGSFVDNYIELAGGINIARESNSWLYSREDVLKKNPDVILIVTMGIVGEREKKIWERFKSLKAVRNNRIYILDSYKICSPTPITFADMLEELVEILHKG